MNANVKTPWYTHSDGVPLHLEYPDCSMVDLLQQAADGPPSIIAYEFFGAKATYRQLMEQIHRCAAALCAMGR